MENRKLTIRQLKKIRKLIDLALVTQKDDKDFIHTAVDSKCVIDIMEENA